MNHISTPSFHSIPSIPFYTGTSITYWNDEDAESGSSEVDEYGDAWIVDGCRSQRRVNSPLLDVSTSYMVDSPPISTQPIPSNSLETSSKEVNTPLETTWIDKSLCPSKIIFNETQINPNTEQEQTDQRKRIRELRSSPSSNRPTPPYSPKNFRTRTINPK